MFATLLGSAFFCLFNETLLSVGDDVLMRRFNLNYVTVQWTMGGFLVAMSVTVPLLAFVINAYSTKLVISLALSLACIGLAVDFFSPSFWVLIVGRVIEGLGAGFITPLLFFSALTLFSPKHRGHVIS
ncbi:MAG: MFS transporter, partial [Aeriscardovia sp.]|nr:MFS transporter [Aeriscardovia sp.]